jgi:hypothetical protein
VAVQRADMPMAIMRIIVRAPLSAFSAAAAFAQSFILSDDDHWELMAPLSDEGIELELTRAGMGDHLSWQRIAEGDIPGDRTHRNAWEIT